MEHRHRKISSTAAATTVLVAILVLASLSLAGTASAQQPAPITNDAVPVDTDCDGLYEDINDDGSRNVVDVQSMFANLDTITSRDDATMFDANDDGKINVVDVQSMFANLDQGSDTRLDLCTVEQKVHDYINEERQDEGLNPIDRDTKLSQIARYHSEDMAKNDDLSHTGSDGDGFGARYNEFGYECKAYITDTRFSRGAENIAQTFYQAQITGGANHETEDELARAIVSQWMHSDGHRDNILKDYWNNEGIGLATLNDDGNTKVYVTQNFC